MVEQSSENIWQAVSYAVRTAVFTRRRFAGRYRGIGFDATCSLVVLGEGGRSLPVGPSENPGPRHHRLDGSPCVEQAERINAQGHDVLRYVGGRIFVKCRRQSCYG